MPKILISFFLLCCLSLQASAQDKKRVRELGITPGILTPGKYNAITDVDGVSVGHKTVLKGDSVRTGVTIIIPHQGNIFQQKVPAAVAVGNGFGKALGTTQIKELGNLETPVALTGTLNAFLVADALIDYTLSQPGNQRIRSVNPVVGETNDGWLNDIRGRHVSTADVFEAIKTASSGRVAEGSVGAGTGTLALGFKGGIGTSSRVLPAGKGGYTVGVLVQTNFGGILTINGAPVGIELDNYYMGNEVPYEVDGSVMIVVATDAPLSARNLERLAKRTFLALGRVGSFISNGSGDYSIAFSTNPELRIPYAGSEPVRRIPDLHNDELSPLFLAAVEATEEAVYNSLFMAVDVKGQKGREMKSLPVQETLEILKKYNVLK